MNSTPPLSIIGLWNIPQQWSIWKTSNVKKNSIKGIKSIQAPFVPQVHGGWHSVRYIMNGYTLEFCLNGTKINGENEASC